MNKLSMLHGTVSLVVLSLWLLAGCGTEDKTAEAPTAAGPVAEEQSTTAVTATAMVAVDGNRIINADSEPGNWLTHGRTYDEQRYSPLAQINAGNVSNLGLA